MDPNIFPAAAGVGIAALILWLVLLVVGFVLSALIMSLYVRLVIRFMRKTLDREYRYMRGDYSNGSAPVTSQPHDPRRW